MTKNNAITEGYNDYLDDREAAEAYEELTYWGTELMRHGALRRCDPEAYDHGEYVEAVRAFRRALRVWRRLERLGRGSVESMGFVPAEDEILL